MEPRPGFELFWSLGRMLLLRSLALPLRVLPLSATVSTKPFQVPGSSASNWVAWYEITAGDTCDFIATCHRATVGCTQTFWRELNELNTK
ncbi:hypothetical protein K469DRAFT_68193 [Zopfia rhizophila CBS 207.26]|uniref:LysM domain-containing protein n=1 Tax=Zopfia rhizophila CBS 207.26 TaxID=1314779 RepID=A0A6A6D7B1_9PEZI|nr:hypothetical protein K469DRAFT_68193 [Zopfia rhizophila CBS 207.26]